ncbi:MAG: MFS transporter [Simkaniaceae bacterium]|nr:MFS transporter [Simkaniaceae bacterium]
MSLKKNSLFSIFFTFAVDNLGATIVFPIFAPLFLDPTYNLIGVESLLSYKMILLGWFLAIYPIMQFIFSPILGDYADHSGRQKALALTTILTCIGFFTCSWSIAYHNLLFLFLGRMVMGIGAGNLSICMSALSDLSASPAQKVKYFSYGSALAGVTFVLGPLVGGKLSDQTFIPFFTIASPMWIGGILAFFNTIFIFWKFTETIKEKSHVSYDFLKGIRNFKYVFQVKGLRSLYFVYFLYLLAWNIFFQFMPAYAVEKFHIGTSEIGDIAALMGLCWVLGSGMIAKAFHKWKNPRYALAVAFFIFAIFTHFISYFPSLLGFSALVALATAASGVIWPLCTGAISNLATEKMQGKILGLSQSVLSLTMVISAACGGYFLQFNLTLPFTLAAIALILAGLWILTHSGKHNET